MSNCYKYGNICQTHIKMETCLMVKTMCSSLKYIYRLSQNPKATCTVSPVTDNPILFHTYIKVIISLQPGP